MCGRRFICYNLISVVDKEKHRRYARVLCSLLFVNYKLSRVLQSLDSPYEVKMFHQSPILSIYIYAQATSTFSNIDELSHNNCRSRSISNHSLGSKTDQKT